MAKLYKIFVSHSWTHVNDLKLLKNLLESRGYFNVEFTEFPPTDSINSTNTYYVRQRIAERISASNIVIGIAGIYASYSDWMRWELDKAIEKRIPVIGVIPRGMCRFPLLLVAEQMRLFAGTRKVLLLQYESMQNNIID